MNNRNVLLGVIFSLLLSGASIGVNGSEFDDDKHVSLTYLSYPPFYDEALLNKGPISEIITEAFKHEGYSVQLEQLPWARALKWTKQGKYDGIFTAWHRKEREEFFLYSDPLPENALVLFKRKDSTISFQHYSELKPYTIGIVRGYVNPVEITDAGLKLEVVNTDKQNLQKIIQSHLDMCLTDRSVGRYILATQLGVDADKVDWLEPPVKTELQYLMFSKAAVDYKAKHKSFNRGLQAIKDSGLYQEILDKHQL